MPIFLTSQLNLSVSLIDIIEGIAESTSSISKFLFGVWSDYLRKRKPFVVSGYTAATIYRVLIAIAQTWEVVLVGRFLNRLGKGLRTAARDSMLLESASAHN